MSHSLALAPPHAMGVTHVWSGVREEDGRNCLPLSDELAATLVLVGLIEYSGIYRVYRPREGVELKQIKQAIA